MKENKVYSSLLKEKHIAELPLLFKCIKEVDVESRALYSKYVPSDFYGTDHMQVRHSYKPVSKILNLTIRLEKIIDN